MRRQETTTSTHHQQGKDVIKTMKNNKAPVEDDIVVGFWKANGKALEEWVHQLIMDICTKCSKLSLLSFVLYTKEIIFWIAPTVEESPSSMLHIKSLLGY